MRARLLLLPLTLLVPLTTSCSDEASAAEVVAGAASVTMEETTVAMAVSADMSDLPGVGELVIEGEGEADFKSGRASMTMDMTELLRQSGAPADVDGTFETLIDGTVMYMRAGALTAELGIPAGTWLKADLQEFGESQGIDMAQAQQPGTGDPRQGLAMLTGVTEIGVEELGEEDVRGVSTTHYRAEVDLRKAIEQADAITDPEAFERFIDTMGTDTMDVEVWIDDEGRLRRMTMEMPLPTGAGGDAEIRTTSEFYDFGRDVDLEPPAEEDTRDIQELLSAAGG